MEIQRYLEILEHQKWVVVLTTVVAVAIVGLGSCLITPIYSASTLVRVAQPRDGSIDYFDLDYSVRLMNTYAHVLRSRPFLEEVIRRLDLNILSEDLAKSIKAEGLTDTELLRITVESTNPRQAADIANTLATLLIEQSRRVYFGQAKTAREILQEQLTLVEENLTADRALLRSLLDDESGQDQAGGVQNLNRRIQIQEQTYATLLNEYDRAQVEEAMRANSVSVVEPAIVPHAPSKPRMKLNIGLGALVGLVGGAGLAFLFGSLAPVIHSVDDLEAVAEVPILASIPGFALRRRSRHRAILLNSDGRSPAGEAFRILGSSILSLASGQLPKTLLIASAEPGAGKSTVLANLAIAMAQAGRQVIVVDSDLRAPCLHEVFDLDNELGVSNVILDLSGMDRALQDTKIQGVRVLPSGPVPPNPAELLGLSKMEELIKRLAEDTDIVLLDSPPMLAIADTAVLAPMVDGVLLVAARHQATGKCIQKALRQLDMVGAKALGLVLNKAKASDGAYYYSRYR